VRKEMEFVFVERVEDVLSAAVPGLIEQREAAGVS
jgi:hypothetical protein